ASRPLSNVSSSTSTIGTVVPSMGSSPGRTAVMWPGQRDRLSSVSIRQVGSGSPPAGGDVHDPTPRAVDGRRSVRRALPTAQNASAVITTRREDAYRAYSLGMSHPMTYQCEDCERIAREMRYAVRLDNRQLQIKMENVARSAGRDLAE